MSSKVTLCTLATQLLPLAKDNYRIERKNPAEQADYIKLQAYDTDNNGYIDIKEFRNYYLGTLKQTTVSAEISDARCQAADVLLDATETTDPQVLEAAFSYLTAHDTTLTKIMQDLALDKTQPHIRQYFNAMVLFTQGISEDTWDEILTEIFAMGKDKTEPAGAIYALDFLFSIQRYFPSDPESTTQYVQTLQKAIQNPAIYNNPTYMQKALRTLCLLDKTIGSTAINTYVIEQLGQPLPPYENLAALLYDTSYSLKEQAIPLITQLFRLTSDSRFHNILRQTLTELYSIEKYSSASAALSEVNGLVTPEATLGSMIRTLLSIGGNNPNLIIEKNIPAEYPTYTMLAAYDTDRNNIISVLEYRNYYLKKMAPQNTLPLFSDKSCLYVQDLFSAKPTSAVIDQSIANVDNGEALIGNELPYNVSTQQAMKDMLVELSRDTSRSGLSRLAAIQQLLNYLSFHDTEEGNWPSVLSTTLETIALQTQDPQACLEIGYYIFCQQAGSFKNTTSYRPYLKQLEQLRKSPQINKSPKLLKKLDELIAAVKEYL